jgi:GNAT superfamily N-acetyltransferase
MEIRILHEADDRSRFVSGDPDLDRFFQRFAGQNQFRHHLGTTYVAVEGADVVGFATVSPGQLEIDDLPVGRRKQLPRYPLPVLRLARLAVDQRFRSQGVGRRLTRFVLYLAVRLADDFGCVGVLVDAKPGAVAFYRELGFLELEPVEGQVATRPTAASMLLPLAEIVSCRPR